ncbi:MAG TPA: hypothetical protein VEC99_10830 [Clostridia bacterium]|nr:hypothetical protein [Clostridia bacterium]
MNTKPSKARQDYTAKAESSFGRPLNPEERKAVLGFSEAVVRMAIISLSNKEIAGMVSEACSMNTVMALLEQMAGGTDSLAAGRQKLLDLLTPKGRKVVAEFDLDLELDRFSRWFLALLRSDPLPPGIRALNFGLFESESGFRLYVTGAHTYNRKDSEWACAIDWWPEGQYAPLDGLARLDKSLRTARSKPVAGVETWVIAQAIAILLIKAFFERHSHEVRKMLGKKTLFIASGFDEGDLYAIKTSVSPKASHSQRLSTH